MDGQQHIKQLPFAFAKRHAVLVTQCSADLAKVTYSVEADPQALMEVRRFLHCPIVLEQVPHEKFEDLLVLTYEENSN